MNDPAAGAIEPRSMDRKGRRVPALFCAASIALHAIALGVSPQSGTGASRSFDGPAGVLHAVLSPLSTEAEPAPDVASGELLVHAAAAPATSHRAADVPQEGEAGQPTGVTAFTTAAFALPDRWLSPEELSERAEPLMHVEIPYPADLAESGVFGRVRLMLHIDERGVVRKAQIEESLPQGVFDRAAVAAWAEVPFSPATKDGVAVKSRKLLEISFVP